MRARRGDGGCERAVERDELEEGFERGVGDLASAAAADGEDGAPLAQHDTRAHIVEWAFAGARRVGVARFGFKARHAVAEGEAEAIDGDAGAEAIAVGECHRSHVTVAVDSAEVNRAAVRARRGGLRENRAGFHGVANAIGASARVVIGKKFFLRDSSVSGIAEEREAVAPREAEGFEVGVRAGEAGGLAVPIERAQRGEALEHREAAGSERGGADLAAVPREAQRGDFVGAVGGEIGGGHEATVFREVVGDALGDVAAVE